MKQLVISAFLSFLITAYCSAQRPVDITPPTTRPTSPPRPRPPSTPASTITVTFNSDDTCNVSINGKDYGEFATKKTISLPYGSYKLFFESLETGKIIKNPNFQLVRDSITGRTYKYSVTFEP